MASLIHLDTHVVAWLFAGELSRFTQGGLEALESHDLQVSPMVTLELEYLFEIGSTGERGKAVVDRLQEEIGLQVCDLPFPLVVSRALAQNWTRDPFDRLIVSQALLAGAPLLTRDRTLQEGYPQAFW
jgi:PIN domain nuclease of toxin-antitoxin system